MREFTVKNSRGESFDVMNWENGCFFSAPDGLGKEYTTVFAESGGYWIQTDRKLRQPVISGQMIFANYKRYLDFVRFAAHEPLTIGYLADTGMTQYYIDCKIARIEKSERDKQTGLLYCPVAFVCLSPWYAPALTKRTAIDTETAKVYTYDYPYRYYDDSAGIITLDNIGVENCPCRITIAGYAEKPCWELSASGNIVATGGLNLTIADGHKVVIDSTPGLIEISEYTSDNRFVANRYGASDFSTARFIWLPPGISSIRFSHEGTNAIIAYVEVKSIAASV